MSKFTDTLEAVKEENLLKPDLEKYHKILCELKGEMKLELATILKKKFMFLAENRELPAVHREINWKSSELGQREIDLKGFIGALNASLEGVKARLFSIY